MTDSIEFDLIIAGSGLAGLRAAIEAAKKNQKINGIIQIFLIKPHIIDFLIVLINLKMLLLY